MKPTRELEGLEIVIVGSMNPPIFHPEWFARQQLVQQSEAEKATIDVVSPDVASFSLGWARVQVVREYISFSTNQAQHYELLRDLVAGTFNYLKFTPLSQFGINMAGHFRFEKREQWPALAKQLAPTKIWDGALTEPRMLSLNMQGAREDGHDGNVNVTIEQSVRVNPGLYIRVNDHFDLQQTGDESSAEKVIRVLSSEFPQSIKRYKTISEAILSYE